MDSLNFVVYWDPTSYDQQQVQTTSPDGNVPPTALCKIRILCNHAVEKKNLLERIKNIKHYIVREPNTFANQKSHAWVWYYSLMVPKCVQTKTI